MVDVDSIKQALENTLNGNILSTDSIYGILIIVGIAWLVYRGIKKATSSLSSILGFILLLEIGHIVAFSTALGSDIPLLQQIFKYDVLTALAQLCVGTKVSDFLLYVQAYLTGVLQLVLGKIAWLFNHLMANLPAR